MHGIEFSDKSTRTLCTVYEYLFMHVVLSALFTRLGFTFSYFPLMFRLEQSLRQPD